MVNFGPFSQKAQNSDKVYNITSIKLRILCKLRKSKLVGGSATRVHLFCRPGDGIEKVEGGGASGGEGNDKFEPC